MSNTLGIRLASAAAMLLVLAASLPALAASRQVLVLDADGAPVPDVAVFVDQPAGASSAAPGQTATMDQVDTRFVPHILVIQKGTLVEFPNSDVVAHHVYSFSKPNNFVLPLYKGDAYKPIRFDYPGIVILGCNIHDGMLGYIVVVESEIFGVTDEAGQVTLELDDTSTESVVKIWSPRIRDDENLLSRIVGSGADGYGVVTFVLQKKLRPPHDAQAGAVQWSGY